MYVHVLAYHRFRVLMYFCSHTIHLEGLCRAKDNYLYSFGEGFSAVCVCGPQSAGEASV